MQRHPCISSTPTAQKPSGGRLAYGKMPLTERIQSRLEESAAAGQGHDFAEALKHGEVALRLAKGTSFQGKAAYNLGVLLATFGSSNSEYERALECLLAAQRAGYLDSEMGLHAGKMLFNLKRNAEADARLTEYILLCGEKASQKAFYYRGRARFYLGRLEKAIADFDVAEGMGFETYRLFFIRGWAKARLGRLEPALEDFERAEQFRPASGVFWFQYGFLLCRLSDHRHTTSEGVFDRELRRRRARKALACFLKARRLGYCPPELYGEMGLAKKALGDYAGAEECFREAIRQGAREALFYRNALVETLLAQEKADGAAIAIDEMEAAGAERTTVLKKRAEVLLAKGMAAGALELLSRVAEEGAGNGQLHLLLGTALNRCELYQEALAELEKAREMGVQSGAFDMETGAALLHLDQPDAACSAFSRAEAKGVATILVKFLHARALNSSGKHKKAMKKLAEQEQLRRKAGKPVSGGYYYEMGYALSRLADENGRKRNEEALPYFGKALAMGYRPYYCHVEKCAALIELGMFQQALLEVGAAKALGAPEKEKCAAKLQYLEQKALRGIGGGQPAPQSVTFKPSSFSTANSLRNLGARKSSQGYFQP